MHPWQRTARQMAKSTGLIYPSLMDPELRSPFQVGGWFYLEPMRKADFPEVLAIERVSFKGPWSRASFEAEMDKAYAGLEVARLTSEDRLDSLLGYVCFWLVADELQITNIAVHPHYRQRKIGLHLLLHTIHLAYKAGARLAVLEVGFFNKAARALYEKLGFVAGQKRSRYYHESNEDAVVMTLDLDQWWARGSDRSRETEKQR